MNELINKLSLALVAISFALVALKAAQPEINPSHIDAYVTPYYDSKGPEVKLGRFSSGLASAKEDDFLATIAQMKKDWDRLTFPELYVAAIRLYDLGYRKESVYWFNSALADGMNQLISMLKEKKDDIKRQRIERGVEEKFSKLTSKELTSH